MEWLSGVDGYAEWMAGTGLVTGLVGDWVSDWRSWRLTKLETGLVAGGVEWCC